MTNFNLSVQIKVCRSHALGSCFAPQYHTVHFVPVWNWKNLALCCVVLLMSDLHREIRLKALQMQYTEYSQKVESNHLYLKVKLIILYIYSDFLYFHLSISPFLIPLFKEREGMERCGEASGRGRMWLLKSSPQEMKSLGSERRRSTIQCC